MIDSTDPIGPGAVLFTREFYADCRRALKKGGVLVTQNGLPFLQGPQLQRSVAYLRALFADAFAYLATTPSYVGGSLSFGWATDNAKLRQHSKKKIEKRYQKAPFETRYWRPDVHVAAFALPSYVLELVSDR
jgi:spermidine synthase